MCAAALCPVKYRVPAANFPPEDAYRAFFTSHDLYDFPKLKTFEEKTGIPPEYRGACSLRGRPIC